MDQITASKLKGRIWLSLCQMSSTSPTAKAGTENMQWCLVPRVDLSAAMWLSLHSQGQTKENRHQRTKRTDSRGCSGVGRSGRVQVKCLGPVDLMFSISQRSWTSLGKRRRSQANQQSMSIEIFTFLFPHPTGSFQWMLQNSTHSYAPLPLLTQPRWHRGFHKLI